MVTFHGLEPNEPNQQTEKKTAVKSVPLVKSVQLSRPNSLEVFPVGRPSKFSWPFAKLLCERIQNGEFLSKICDEKDMPNHQQINVWMNKYPKFKQWIERSRMVQADKIAEQSVTMFEEAPPMEKIQTKNGVYERISMSGVQLMRYQSQARQWYASKWNPDKYGDKLNVQNSLDLSIVLSTVNTKATPKALKQVTKQVNQIIDAQVERKNDTTI